MTASRLYPWEKSKAFITTLPSLTEIPIKSDRVDAGSQACHKQPTVYPSTGTQQAAHEPKLEDVQYKASFLPKSAFRPWRTGRHKSNTPNALVDVVARIMALWMYLCRFQRDIPIALLQTRGYGALLMEEAEWIAQVDLRNCQAQVWLAVLASGTIMSTYDTLWMLRRAISRIPGQIAEASSFTTADDPAKPCIADGRRANHLGVCCTGVGPHA
ncbi:hypothetical protein B0O80DRAFT_530314 [Mortierella sp. GBAus27b]|nr:hypothetical protein B0O80DRAFT_530314 [Mortierella sp. GBAus27b]